MKVLLSLYQEAPAGAAAASREFEWEAPTGVGPFLVLDSDPSEDPREFLAEALVRITAGIAPGEVRRVGVGIEVWG